MTIKAIERTRTIGVHLTSQGERGFLLNNEGRMQYLPVVPYDWDSLVREGSHPSLRVVTTPQAFAVDYCSRILDQDQKSIAIGAFFEFWGIVL